MPGKLRSWLEANVWPQYGSGLWNAHEQGGVDITISRNRFRVSVAVFNDMNDIDKLLDALPTSPP